MCHFLTGCVSKNTDLARLNELVCEIGLERQFRFVEIENAHLISQLPAAAIYCSLHLGQCDCGTVIGAEFEQPPASTTKAKLAKLRAKGWSEAKIARWAREREQTMGRKHQATLAKHREELDQWWSFITSVVGSDLTRHLGLLKHWYTTSVFTERFQFSCRRFPIRNRRAESLSGLKEDVLYLFE